MLGKYVKEYIEKLTTVGIMYKQGIEPSQEDNKELQDLWLYSTKELNEIIEKANKFDKLEKQ